jgi:hypothetical protein
VWRAAREAAWGLLLIVVVLGGIYGGIFTPTEAAAVSAVYAAIIAVFVHRDVRLREVPTVLTESARLTTMLMFIVANAYLFAFVLTTEQIPQTIASAVLAAEFSPWVFLLLVNVLLLVAGTLMDPTSVVLILAPIVFPIAIELGIDPVHLGVIFVVNMEIGLVTPPVGLNLFVASAVSELPVTAVIRASAPWLVLLLAFLVVVTYVPAVSLTLPRLMLGGRAALRRRVLARPGEHALALGRRHGTRVRVRASVARPRALHRYDDALLQRVARPALTHEAVRASELEGPIASLAAAWRPARPLLLDGIGAASGGALAYLGNV